MTPGPSTLGGPVQAEYPIGGRPGLARHAWQFSYLPRSGDLPSTTSGPKNLDRDDDSVHHATPRSHLGRPEAVRARRECEPDHERQAARLSVRSRLGHGHSQTPPSALPSDALMDCRSCWRSKDGDPKSGLEGYHGSSWRRSNGVSTVSNRIEDGGWVVLRRDAWGVICREPRSR